MPDNTIRDWLALLATSLSALFAGLIWWMARKRLSSRFSATVDQFRTPVILVLRIEILNRGDRDIVIEGLSVTSPLSLPIDNTGARHEIVARIEALEAANRVQHVDCYVQIEPEKHHAFNVVVAQAGGFDSCKTVSIALHILTSFPVIRHKKKVLTAILPASTKKKTA